MNIIDVSCVLIVFFLITAGRRRAEVNSNGDPQLRLWGIAGAGLVTAVYFILEGIQKLDDPVSIQNPENLYVIFGLALVGLIASWYCFTMRVVLTIDSIVEHMPFLWHKVLPLSTLKSIEHNISGVVLIFENHKKLRLSNRFSGLPYLLEVLSNRQPNVVHQHES